MQVEDQTKFDQIMETTETNQQEDSISDITPFIIQQYQLNKEKEINQQCTFDELSKTKKELADFFKENDDYVNGCSLDSISDFV